MPRHTASHSAFFALTQWFLRQKRVLPWRNDPSVYRVWISEIMLQQTQVVTVIPYFNRWMKRFPTLKRLSQASEQEVLKLWEGLGYYTRARNILKAAKLLKTQGFPHTREGWLLVPGVGPYTAGAILSIATEKPEAILDGNVERVLSRVFAHSKRSRPRLWSLSRGLIKRAYQLKLSPSVFNQALMELGATLCSPKKPNCLFCPLKTHCKAFKKGYPEDYPIKIKRKSTLQLKEKVWVRWNTLKDQVYLEHPQNHKKWRLGLWDFPEQKLEKEKFKKHGLHTFHYFVTHHKIYRTHQVEVIKKINLKNQQQGQWVDRKNPSVPISAPVKRALKHLPVWCGFELFPEELIKNSRPASGSVD